MVQGVVARPVVARPSSPDGQGSFIILAAYEDFPARILVKGMSERLAEGLKSEDKVSLQKIATQPAIAHESSGFTTKELV